VSRSEHSDVSTKRHSVAIPFARHFREALYSVCDQSGSDLICYEDFFDGLAVVLKGSIEDKIKFLFGIMTSMNRTKFTKQIWRRYSNCMRIGTAEYVNDFNRGE
jgi:hypothetical protein